MSTVVSDGILDHSSSAWDDGYWNAHCFDEAEAGENGEPKTLIPVPLTVISFVSCSRYVILSSSLNI